MTGKQGSESGGSLLFGDFVQEQYLSFIRRNKRSWKTDERYLASHILPYLGSMPLADITETTLCVWLAGLERAGLSASSRYRMFWLVKYVLNCAVRWHALASDEGFCRAVIRRSVPRLPELLTASERQKLIGLLMYHRDNVSARAIHFLLLTGASKSEVLYARWEDVDTQGRTLAIRRGFSREVCRLPLSAEAVALISSFPVRDGVPWLFFRPDTGERVKTLSLFWNRLREELGRPTLRISDLRHVFVQSLLLRGATYKDVRRHLGHYSSEVFFLQAQRQRAAAALPGEESR